MENVVTERAIAPQSFFQTRFGLSARDLESVMARALERRIDYADLYFEYEVSEGLSARGGDRQDRVAGHHAGGGGAGGGGGEDRLRLLE